MRFRVFIFEIVSTHIKKIIDDIRRQKRKRKAQKFSRKENTKRSVIRKSLVIQKKYLFGELTMNLSKEKMLSLPRRRLQSMAKAAGVRANMKSQDIVNALLEKKQIKPKADDIPSPPRNTEKICPNEGSDTSKGVVTEVETQIEANVNNELAGQEAMKQVPEFRELCNLRQEISSMYAGHDTSVSPPESNDILANSTLIGAPESSTELRDSRAAALMAARKMKGKNKHKSHSRQRANRGHGDNKTSKFLRNRPTSHVDKERQRKEERDAITSIDDEDNKKSIEVGQNIENISESSKQEGNSCDGALQERKNTKNQIASPSTEGNIRLRTTKRHDAGKSVKQKDKGKSFASDARSKRRDKQNQRQKKSKKSLMNKRRFGRDTDKPDSSEIMNLAEDSQGNCTTAGGSNSATIVPTVEDIAALLS